VERGHTADPAVLRRTAAPIVIGVGRTGLRVCLRLRERAAGSLRLLVCLPHEVAACPSPVPTLAWSEGPGTNEGTGRKLRDCISGARGGVVVCGLRSKLARAIAPAVARAAREELPALAAVGVAPFSFEGPARREIAEATAAELARTCSVVALARRDGIRGIVPAETPLERACALVDETAAGAAEGLARLAGAGRDVGGLSSATGRVLSAGAGEGAGERAGEVAVERALTRSLLSSDDRAGAEEVFIALAAPRAPTVGTVSTAEEAAMRALGPDASVTVEFAADPSLGDRALAVALLPPRRREREDGVFPAEDRAALEIPAFIRKRSAALALSPARGSIAPGRSA
jgi:cell division protein FtsZ